MKLLTLVLLIAAFARIASSQNYGWYDGVQCHPACNQCYYGNNPYYCSNCAGNHLNNYWNYPFDNCYCPDQYVELGQAYCQPCQHQCYTCSSSTTYCTSCSTIQRVGVPSCQCGNGYYDVGVPNCAVCSYQCTTCVSSATNCLTCPTTRTGAPSCSCSAGYYQTGTTTCPTCHYSCATCNAGTSADCLSCNSAYQRYLSGTSCLCNAPYYDNGSSSACQTCHISCSSCVAYSVCTSCNASNLRYLSNTTTTCVCQDRFYDSGAQICSSCHPTCYRCSSSTSTSCTACNSTAFRIISGTTCICMNGYYQTLSTQELCTVCSYSCLTCITLATTCLTCNSTLNRVISGNTCLCNAGYFQNSTLLCDTCHPSCATCSNKTACITCIASQGTTLNSSTLCSCISTQYYTGSVCASCNYKCLTCYGSSTNCTSCQAGSYRIYKSNLCNCQSYYYDSGSVTCTACAYSCLTCNGIAKTNCLTCLASTLRTFSASSCNCPTKYYDDGINANCSPCNYKCLTCTNSSGCLTCSAANYRSLNATTGYCQCFSNYFQSNLVCYACISTCLTCSNNLTCNSCNSALQLTLNAANLCICVDGYYNSSNVCLACSSVCQTCAAASTCLSCKAGLNRIFNSTASTCDCQTGYVLNTSSNLCVGCQYSCQVCVTNFTNQCSSCNASNFRTLNASIKQCPCNVGYYDNNAALCLPCSYTCYTCSVSASNCTACTTGSNRVLNSTYGTCPCAQHYYDTIVVYVQNVTCASCPYFCSSCTNSSACLTCNSTNHRIIDSFNVNCTCSSGYYDDGTNELCATCPYQCQTCTNSSVCLTCNSSKFRITPSSLCPCNTRYYDTGLSAQLCVACHYSCKTCTDGTKCVTCQTNYNRLYNSTTKYCSCLGRYYDPGSQICQSCTYSCLTCSGGPLNCLTCNTTSLRTLNTTAKTCPCNNGYYDGAIQPCYPCNYTCSTCGNNLSCITCNITRFRAINAANGLCICITGYYDNNSTQLCVQCNLTCLTCLNSTTCLTCDANRNRVSNTTKNYANVSDPFCPCIYGYYSLGVSSSCAACHFSCAACNGPNIINCLYCDSNSKRTLNASTCTCNTGYYDTNLTMNCPLCNVACTSCWNALTTTCFTCNPAYFMMVGKNTCYSICPTYYFNNVSAKVCSSCSTHCLSCINGTNCTKCQAPTFLYNLTCNNNCPLGYYGNTTLNQCILCRQGCANCSTGSNCFKCMNSSYYVDTATTLCFLCSTKCVTCFGPNLNQCLNCTYPQYLNNQSTCVNISCPYGQYIDTFKGCVNCSSLFANSLTCSIDQAFLCMQTTQLKNGKCVVCDQVLGYALDYTGKCNEICGDGILIKYPCDDGNNHNGDGCTANCQVEDGWTCKNISNRSSCSLNSPVTMTLKTLQKYPKQNKLLVTLKVSIPLYLDKSNFFLAIVDFDPSYYSIELLPQSTSDLTEVSVIFQYIQSIQSKALQVSYQNSRRLQEKYNTISFYEERVLTSITFQTDVVIAAFPPAIYIDTHTTTFYQKCITAICYLSIVFVCLNLIIVPQRYAVHSLTNSWIIPYFYIAFFQSTAYTNQWISSTLTNVRYQSLFGGINFGQCCYNDTFQNITSQIFTNTGFIFAGLALAWALFFLSKLIDKCRQEKQESKLTSMLKYYLLTLHLTVYLQLAYSSMYALSKYQLSNRIDAANITISLFIAFSVAFLAVMIWYITAKNKFVGTQDEIQSKAATRQSATVQNSNNTQEPDFSPVINLNQIKQKTRYDDSKFYISNNLKASKTQFKPSEQIQSQTKSQTSEEEEMGNDESLLPYDYCFIYKNKDKRSKYYLPLLVTKLFIISFVNVAFQKTPFQLMILTAAINFIFLLWLVIVRPFNSTFTNARNIIIQLLITLANGLFCLYLYFANNQVYIITLQTCIIVNIIIVLALSIIFSLVQHYRIWIYKLWKTCDGCCLYFKLKGKSQKVMDESAPQREQIQVQPVSQTHIMQSESDVFYTRFLKKQALNKQFKNQRMGRSAFEKDLYD